MSLRALFAPLARLFNPTAQEPPRRSPEEQARIDGECARLALYQFNSCPFCVKVRRAIARLDLDIEIRDIRLDHRFRDELIEGGGAGQVPCLRIDGDDGSVRWLYESYDIIKYLEGRFSSERS